MRMKKQIVTRPWGNFEQFTHNESTTVKIITVNPRESLSLQTHAKREEFWRIISGNGTVTIGKEQHPCALGDEFFIPLGAEHRVTGGENGVTFLEIAFGNFDENDIVRLEDKYGRN